MDEKHDGGPAFPQMQCCDEEGRISPVVIDGMSLRDWFAGLAMQGLIASNDPGAGDRLDEIPQYAYGIADAMIAARETE